MTITPKSRSRTTVTCNINIRTRPTSRFRLVVIHGTRIHPSVPTYSSESCPGTKRMNRATPPLHLSYDFPHFHQVSVPHIVSLLSGFPAKSTLYLALASFPLYRPCCVLFFSVFSLRPTSSISIRGLLSRSRAPLLVTSSLDPLSHPISPISSHPNRFSRCSRVFVS